MRCLKESGQWHENIDQNNLVLASGYWLVTTGKLVVQKTLTFLFMGHSYWKLQLPDRATAKKLRACTRSRSTTRASTSRGRRRGSRPSWTKVPPMKAKRVKLWLTRFFKWIKLWSRESAFASLSFFQDAKTFLAIFERDSNHVRILSALIYSTLEFKKAV